MTIGGSNTPIEASEIDVGSIVASATEHLSFDGSGNVSIPNGDLDLGTNDLSNIDKIGPGGSINHIWPDSTDSSALEIGYNSNGVIRFGSGTTNNLSSVEIASGALNMGGGDVYESNIFKYSLNNGPSSVQVPVDGTSAAGTEHSVSLDVDGTQLVKAYAESDGAGGIQNAKTILQNGNVEIPNGQLSEQGNRVATRAWTTGGNILAADLGFDTATQSELDSHTSDTTNPHSVTATQVSPNGRRLPQREAESGNIELASTDSAYVFHRQNVPSGKTLYIYEMGLQDEANTAPSGITVEAYDETNAVSLASKNTKYTEATPITSKSGAIDVAFRLNNSSAATNGYNGFVIFALV